MYQKCPICFGTGIDQISPYTDNATPVCPTCKGKRIINELTGKPPNDVNADGQPNDCNCINGVPQTTGGCKVHGVKY